MATKRRRKKDPTPSNPPGDGSSASRPTTAAKSKRPARGPAACPYVVGIGASAGGLEPLGRFFESMPIGSGAAFVVIQHLSPDFKSLMKELLSRHTTMAVYRVEDRMELEPDSVYLIPPKKNMIIRKGQLRLTEQNLSPGHGPNYPIDVFFDSLARELGERAIGIILSGTGSDGSRGIRSINEHGGLVMVQEPETAQFDGMPRSAITAGSAHYVQPPEEIARSVYKYVTNMQHTPDTPLLRPAMIEEGFLAQILKLLKREDGIDFSCYKPTTLGRRIQRRMMIGGFGDLTAYVARLEESAQEREALRRDLLISVTSFFRDPEAWAILKDKIIPALIAQTTEDDPLRVWVTACATGEEVYSLAMLIQEELDAVRKPMVFKIFATDIDASALERAAAGMYPESVAGDIGTQRIKRFFIKSGQTYQVNRELRERVIFATHDLTKDAPFTRMHLVLCRNALIYMQPTLQTQVLAMLHFALRLHGVLFLGAAETLANLEAEFDTADTKWKIFVKKRDVRLPLDDGRRMAGLLDPSPRAKLKAPGQTGEFIAETMATQAFGDYLRQREAVCMLLNNSAELTHAFGDVDRYLRMPQGRQTVELSRLLPKELNLPLSTALNRVRREKTNANYTGIDLPGSDGTRQVNLRVSFHAGTKVHPDAIMVLIEPCQDPRQSVRPRALDVDSESAHRIEELERELQHTRENLQTTIEELETTNEEQQATNEEMLASNEELQSTNEELHSVNEELRTVNAEYQTKIQELTDLNNDINNLLRSTNIGTIFLDEDLNIRKFTPAITEVVNILDHDIGRPLSHLTFNVDDPRLFESIRRVLENGRSIERDIRTRNDRSLLMRAHPYVTERGQTQGVVLTFVDISELKQVQRDLQHTQEALEQRGQELLRANERLTQLAAIVEFSQDAITSKTLDGTITSWNAGAQALYGYTAEEAIGQKINLIILPHRQHEPLELLARVGRGEDIEPFETERVAKDGRRIAVSMRISPLRDHEHRIIGASVIARDITARKEAENKLRISEDRFRAAAENSFESFYLLHSVRDASGEVIDFEFIDLNRRGAEMIGRKREQILGHRFAELLPEIRADGFLDKYRQVLRTGQALEEEIAIHGRGFRAEWIQYQVVPVGDGIAITVRDTSDRKYAEQERETLNRELQTRNAALKRANADIEAFVYSASHDLRGPLINLQGFTDRLGKRMTEILTLLSTSSTEAAPTQRLREIIEGDVRKSMSHITNSVDQFGTIIDGLLKLSRTGRQEFAPIVLDMNDTARKVVGVFNEMLETREVQVSIEPLAPAFGDAEAVNRVLSNLVSNAINFLDPKRTGTIRIGLAGSDNGFNRYFVQDNGIGIDPRHQDKIFRLFHRLMENNAPGEGIGLALVKKLIERHEGEVAVESTPGVGSTFFFTLPAHADAWQGHE